MTLEEFKKAARELYGDEFSYSNVTESGVRNGTNIPIRCPKHGMFWETPYQHLHGIIHCLECHKIREWGKNENGA